MPRKIYVVGHMNSAPNSVVSVMAYADRFPVQGVQNVVAGRQTGLWQIETGYWE
jgi:hypothetical protein